jgi:hypothetical protein
MQTKDAIVERALALGLIAIRAQYENGIRNRAEVKERCQQLGQELLTWARSQRIDSFLSENERELHEKKLGDWSDDEIGERFWRIESLKAVLWCIQVLERMPPYSEVGRVNDVYASLPVGKEITRFRAHAVLRAEEVVEKEREFAEFLNWRCRTELLRLQGMQPPMGDNYSDVVARALPVITESNFPIEHDGVDILVNGVRFIDLGDEKGQMMSICYERHLALEWVLGDDEWDEARADT